jgi:hypothetical protein
MRSDKASDQLQTLRDQLDAVRSSVLQALERVDALANPPRRGPLGIAVPFTRHSLAADLASSLRDWPSSVSTPRFPNVSAPRLPTVRAPQLPAVRLQRRSRDWSGAFAAAAVLFGALGLGLLWFGNPRQALETLTRRSPTYPSYDVAAPMDEPISAI